MTVNHYFKTWRSVDPENFNNFECILKCSRKNHQMLCWNWLSWGCPRKGRPRVTSAAEEKFIGVTSLRNRKLTAPQIRASQSSSCRHISTSTVQRRLCELGLHGQISAKKPLLRKNHMKKRIAWAKKNKEWTLDHWKSVLWSDESKFESFGSTPVSV